MGLIHGRHPINIYYINEQIKVERHCTMFFKTNLVKSGDRQEASKYHKVNQKEKFQAEKMSYFSSWRRRKGTFEKASC